MDLVTVEDWGEKIFGEGIGMKWKQWARGEEKEKCYITSRAPPLSLHFDSAPSLYWSSIQLQSKMAASKTWFMKCSAPK